MIRLSDMMSTRRGMLLLVGGFLMLALMIVLAVNLIPGGGRDVVREPYQSTTTDVMPADDGAETASAPAVLSDVTEEGAPDTADGMEFATESATDEATPAAAASGGDQGDPNETWQSGIYAPEPEGEGYLPIFRKADRPDKVVAITVDDCFQTNNLKQIIAAADAVGGKITIFPIGELLQRESLQEIIREAHENGHEIENHTWSHDSLYDLTNEELAAHIFDQDRAVDLVLGKNYHAHFLRPRGGDDRHDLRTHSYIRQLGYYGIAHWSDTGSASLETSKKALAPGVVYLFHCTDKDLNKLLQFIPYTAEQGYRLVTLNEMFGYKTNYEEPLTDDPKTREVIPLEPYERNFRTIKANAYGYDVQEIQAALKAAGYYKDEPDGIYGKGTAKCAAKWQKANGYKADGVLTAEQQRKLLGVD